MNPPTAVRRFEVPPERFAAEPPEVRGVARDGVRLLVAAPEGVTHGRFHDLPRFLAAGDLLVVNDSATVAAAVDGRRADGRAAAVHFAGPLPDGDWIVELRDGDGGRLRDARPGEPISLPHGVVTTVVAPYGDPRDGRGLWRARTAVEGGVARYLDRAGRPVVYGYVQRHWPLDAYQTVFAREPGSAEMPSAGRPFSERVLADLAARGVRFATVTLHTGVSSAEAGELPLPERYAVPAVAAALVNATRAAGGRVVAVGTSVTRALETVAAPGGTVTASAGVTELLLGHDRPARVVTGLVTGWHEADASHLLLLDAVAGRELVDRAYAAALDAEYLWHEFGDSCLLLPERQRP